MTRSLGAYQKRKVSLWGTKVLKVHARFPGLHISCKPFLNVSYWKFLFTCTELSAWKYKYKNGDLTRMLVVGHWLV